MFQADDSSNTLQCLNIGFQRKRDANGRLLLQEKINEHGAAPPSQQESCAGHYLADVTPLNRPTLIWDRTSILHRGETLAAAAPVRPAELMKSKYHIFSTHRLFHVTLTSISCLVWADSVVLFGCQLMTDSSSESHCHFLLIFDLWRQDADISSLQPHRLNAWFHPIRIQKRKINTDQQEP